MVCVSGCGLPPREFKFFHLGTAVSAASEMSLGGAMDVVFVVCKSLRAAVVCGTICLVTLAAGTGCQQQTKVTHRRLIQHQAMIDFSGLKPAAEVAGVNARAAVPRNWEQLALDATALYTHQQWKSPSTRTGVGVANLRMPLPLTTNMVLWLAKREYTKKANDGRVLAEWTDELGRPWFEVENARYRVRGYIAVSGFQAWVVYFGHKTGYPPDPAELSLAARAADSVVPNLSGPKPKPANVQTAQAAP
jgi:hypothetical protein